MARPEVIQGNRYNRNSETRGQNREQLVRTIDIAYGKQDNVYSQFRRPAKITATVVLFIVRGRRRRAVS